jgi:hypothetical protein
MERENDQDEKSNQTKEFRIHLGSVALAGTPPIMLKSFSNVRIGFSDFSVEQIGESICRNLPQP